MKTYSDSESLGESGEASQGILSCIGGLLSIFSGAAESITVVYLKYCSLGDFLWSL
jgi:hypothetical protein